MSLPLPNNSEVFSTDQQIQYKGWYWNSTTTPIKLGPAFTSGEQREMFGSGVRFALFNLLSSTFSPTNRVQLENALAFGSGVTQAVLGYDTDLKYRSGIVSNIYMYWGAGAPPGGNLAQHVLLKFSGFVQNAVDNATLVFAGQGTVLAVVTHANGAQETICSGRITEPVANIDLSTVTATVIQDQWGYLLNTTPMSFVAGDFIEIYYWHNGEPWGGIACKVIPGGADLTSFAFLDQLRAAGIVGASFMTTETTPIAAQQITSLGKVTLQRKKQTVPSLTMEVPLVSSAETGRDPDGWVHTTVNDEEFLAQDNGGLQLHKGRTVFFEAGYRTPSGADELYPRFVGYIEDIQPSADGTTASIICKGMEGKLGNLGDENMPDRLSYLAMGYILRERASQPVFPIPAYDNWPLELAVMDLCARAGIDAYNLGQSPSTLTPIFGNRRFFDNESQALVTGARLFAVRALATPGKMVQLERQANYGNIPPLQKDYLLRDDPYLFVADVTKRLWDRAIQLAEHFGYDFSFDAEGQAVLAGRNNPTFFQYMTEVGPYMDPANNDSGGAAQRVVVSAVGGVILQGTNTNPWIRVIEGHFSRLDLYVGVGRISGLNGGLITVEVEVNPTGELNNWQAVSTETFSTWADANEGFYYDNYTRIDGTNAAVIQIMSLPFDHYRVTLTGGGPDNGESNCIYRLNGVAVFERDPEQSFFTSTAGTYVFSTLNNVLSLTPESTYKDLRNQIIVVGSRKAVVTDSVKLDNSPASNPNNPDLEFNVAVAVDPLSIYDPTAPNFVGSKRMTVVFNNKVSDTDFARWLCRTLLFRTRVVRANAQYGIPAWPVLDLNDAMFVTDALNGSVNHTLWVSDFTETWQPDKATTQVTAHSTADMPSYVPREDIDIDSLFSDTADGLGEPAININIGYLNLYGRLVSNLDLQDPSFIRDFATKTLGSGKPMQSDAIHATGTMALSRMAIPDTMYLSWNVGQTQPVVGGTTTRGYTIPTVPTRVLTNNPYRKFFRVSGWNSAHVPTLAFDFQEGDGTPGVYDASYYGFPNLNGQWFVNYDYLSPRTRRDGKAAENPYYDPYTSELGNLVTIDFNLLVSGRVRVSVWDANRSTGQEIPVAWLTAPTSDPEQPDAHYVFLEAGAKEFTWDASDNIGLWNTFNSLDVANLLKGAFDGKPLAVGASYYAWNDKSTNRHTLIGDASQFNFDKDNAPYFTIGQYGRFYVKIEVLNDDLLQKDIETRGSGDPRTVVTFDLPTAYNTTPQTYVYTHLGEPTQCAMRIQDWVGGTTWSQGDVTSDSDWGDYSTPDADATIRDGKPVRITFVPRPRKGRMWESADRTLDTDLVSGKLSRLVHHKATIFDSFWLLSGKSWSDFHPAYGKIIGGIEDKRVVNRMFENEDHTLEYDDSTWQTGQIIKAYEWIFDPSQFRKDFGTGQIERLRYAAYDQLEALPGFDPSQVGGTAVGQRSYIIEAFMAHLFYFSAFLLDRSGRRQWCLDSWTDENGNKRGQIDKSKIVTPTVLASSNDPSSGSYAPQYIVDYENMEAERYLARSIFVRQWKEPGWATGSYAGNPITQWDITNPHQLRFVQLPATSFDPYSGFLHDPINGFIDNWINEWERPARSLNGVSGALGQTIGSGANFMIHRHGGSDSNVASINVILGKSLIPHSYGTWDFDRPGVEGYFKPNPGRDFHPYWTMPIMPDVAMQFLDLYTDADVTRAMGESSLGPTIYEWLHSLDIFSCVASNANFNLRDPGAHAEWYGYAYSDTYALEYFDTHPTDSDEIRNWFYGARVERTVSEIGATGPDSTVVDSKLDSERLTAMFDYSRQDTLDRYEQFRGIRSRAPYADRLGAEVRVQYIDGDRRRASSVQPVKPSGVYFSHLGRYFDALGGGFITAPVHVRVPKVIVHFAEVVKDWFDIRFMHEYVWYSDQYFPVTENGGAAYGYTKDELTRASLWMPDPWWASYAPLDLLPIPITGVVFPIGSPAIVKQFDPSSLFYDAGAWVGWKGDIDSASWSGIPRLAWREVKSVTLDFVQLGKNQDGSGGYWDIAGQDTGMAELRSTFLIDPFYSLLGATVSKRINIFDEFFSQIIYPRLAVGPEVPESRGVWMNLSLPEIYKG